MKHQTLTVGDIKIENVTQRTVAIIGRKGWGKSTILKILAYSAPLELPCYIFDPLGKIEIEGFEVLNITKAVSMNEELIKKISMGFSKIKNTKIIFSYKGLLQTEISTFTNTFFADWHPHNCLVFFDEMQDVCPERSMGLQYSPEVERHVRHDRNENVGFFIATQRPAFTSKNVLGLMDYLILGGVTANQDRKVVEELLTDMLGSDESERVMQKIQTKGFLQGWTVDYLP
jgi:energy-coupling factor transporter ATP-binding protein EcfA2